MLPRRSVLRGGLASLAAAMMSRTLPGCDNPSMQMDAGTDAARIDGGPPDGGPTMFPWREIPSPPALRSRIADIGALSDTPDANGLRLPAGFTSRIIARSNEVVAPSSYQWHSFPDGGATFATEDGGWIYVSNSELPLNGGVGAIRFDSSGTITDAYRILGRTNINCAGGKTPWHTWLSCEEMGTGRVYECDPWGEHPAILRPALGTFQHEAATVDPIRGHLYLTEDNPEGGFYRFVPDRLTDRGYPDLSSGQLEIAIVDADMNVVFQPVPDPTFSGAIPTRMQVLGSTVFRGGEGVWYHENVVYFSTKGNAHVFALDVVSAQLSILYDGSDTRLQGVDNLTVSCCGDVLVAEDGGSMQVVAVLPNSELRPLVQVVDQPTSEITGPAFDPSGTRLYFSSQRGTSGAGITYEIEGPFHEPI